MSEMAQSQTHFLDCSTRPRYSPQILNLSSQEYLPIDITEEAINLKSMGPDESEGPTQSLLHQSAVTEINDSDSSILKECNTNGHGGSDDGDRDRFSKDLSETFKDWFTNSWFTEILALFISVACAVVIPAVLGVYNHKPVPKLPWDVSLNALVSVLSTVAKSSLLYAICAALGQDKWDWYDTSSHGLQRETRVRDRRSIMSLGGEKRLKDMETLDQASRGPLGAMKFLTNRRTALSPTSLGALVVILSLVVDPFTQQVVRLEERQKLVSSDEVWAARVSAPFFCYRDNHIRKDGKALTGCGKVFEDAHHSAIWEPGAYKHPTHAKCPSGNCEWESFHTIEYCIDNGVVESPTGYCDISFNRSEFNEAYNHYNATGKYRVIIQNCEHLFDPLNITLWPRNPSLFDMNEPWQYGFGTQQMFPNSSHSQSLGSPPLIGSEFSVVTGFHMAEQNHNSTHGQSPYLRTRFPTEVITSLNTSENNITNKFGVRIPQPRVIMAHARYDMVPEVIASNSSITDWYRPPIELRINLLEWSALSLCQVERKISVVNGTTLSAATVSKYLQSVSIGWGAADCWATEDHINNNETISSISVKEPTGSFSQDGPWPWRYQADDSTSAFCIWNATFEYDPSYLLKQAFRATKGTNAKGDDVQVWNERWGKPKLDGGEDIDIRASRITRQTLPAIMMSLTAGLNNINYATTNETVTGSYVVRETILVARWGWLTVLFSIELMGTCYLLYVIFRPRSAAGVWKDSIFAVLYHGLDDGAKNTIGHVKNLRDMRKATKYMEVRLDHLREDDRAVLVRD
ncbi:hypothetical protein QBC32DRAFT_127539 [Pseudoneurospora amorphoporcata]|uniref:Uncharacterized protein n=1 Tax=Pseudoneurospora amorphoporcata TaxID=241081 RepID=A0AAN6NW08_9PEZI|nr:hypothetical protein QBC32DRAFT_127539 [Pseudoneurospora amorphoporcata]